MRMQKTHIFLHYPKENRWKVINGKAESNQTNKFAKIVLQIDHWRSTTFFLSKKRRLFCLSHLSFSLRLFFVILITYSFCLFFKYFYPVFLQTAFQRIKGINPLFYFLLPRFSQGKCEFEILCKFYLTFCRGNCFAKFARRNFSQTLYNTMIQ